MAVADPANPFKPQPGDGRRWEVWAVGALPAQGPRRGIVDEVRERLIAVIRSGAVQVNDRLPPEVELGRLFGVSRSVVREAIVSLNTVGITTSLNGRGTFVTSTEMAARYLLGGYPSEYVNEVRRFLEIPAAQLAALRRKEEDVTRLGKILVRLDGEERADRRNQIDAEFHVAIAAATGNPLLAKLAGDLRHSLEDESLAVSSVGGRRTGARIEHQAILQAIAQRNRAAAANAMRAHLDAIDESLASLREPAAAPAQT